MLRPAPNELREREIARSVLCPRALGTIAAGTLCSLVPTSATAADWGKPSITRVGLWTGPEFVRNDGHAESLLTRVERGMVTGTSARFLNGASQLGQASWAWSAATGTLRTGLHGTPEFTRADGWAESVTTFFAPSANTVTGYSTQGLDHPGTLGRGAWAWTPEVGTVRLGYFGPEHTRSDGFRWSQVEAVTSDGWVAGFSTKNPTSTGLTRGTMWVWHPSRGQEQIGLFDDLDAPNEFGGMGPGGFVVGTSSLPAPRAAWVWTPDSGTERLGFFTAQFAHPNTGRTEAQLTGHNGAGAAIGLSHRWLTETAEDVVGWARLADGTQHALEYTDGELGAPMTRLYSRPIQVNASERVVGYTEDRDVNRDRRVAWTWSVQTGLERIGLFDSPEFISASGDYTSTSLTLTNSGFTTGLSLLYNGQTQTTNIGQAAWIRTPSGETHRMGLFGNAEFGTDPHRQLSSTLFVNENGEVAGRSRRFLNLSSRGWATWAWSEATGTVRVGLFGSPEFTRADTYQESTVQAMSDSGSVFGFSHRYLGASLENGRATWVWRADLGTVRTGYFDEVHTQNTTGLQFSENLSWNQSGMVVGRSTRYDSLGAFVGTTLWAFEPGVGSTVPLIFSVSDEGHYHTTFVALTETNWVLGSYFKYEGNTFIQSRAYIWSADRGFAELGEIVDGGLTANGWTTLFNAYGADGVDLIAGYGRIFDGPASTRGAFVLTGIPSPGATPALLLVFIVAMRRRRT